MENATLFYDTETTGFHLNQPWVHPKQPHCVQLGFILANENEILEEHNLLIRPDMHEWEMSAGAEKVHGISHAHVMSHGMDATEAGLLFIHTAGKSSLRVCHNTKFDQKIMTTFLNRCNLSATSVWQNTYCTMLNSIELCKLPGRYGNYKWPKLQELHKFLFDEEFEGAHDALEDVRATMRCYYELKTKGD